MKCEGVIHQIMFLQHAFFLPLKCMPQSRPHKRGKIASNQAAEGVSWSRTTEERDRTGNGGRKGRPRKGAIRAPEIVNRPAMKGAPTTNQQRKTRQQRIHFHNAHQ